MSKSKKKKVNSTKAQQQNVVETQEVAAETVVETQEVQQEVKQEKVKNDKGAKSNKNKKKTNKDNPNSLGKKIKGTASELKKVTWPKFSEVVKQTGVVLAFVAITVVLLLGVNSLLGWIFGLLVG